MQGIVITQMTDWASSLCNTVLQIYKAILIRNITSTSQNLTKLLLKYGSSFYWDIVYLPLRPSPHVNKIK